MPRCATATIIIPLLLLLLSGGVGVKAHTTIGDLNGQPPLYRSNDHELNPTNSFGRAHVPGPLAYVWPGSGLGMYLDDPRLPPGYQTPSETFEQPPQLAANSYSPEGAIPASTPSCESIGDLIIAINFSQPTAFATPSNPSPRFRYNNISIYIPAPIIDGHGELLQDGFTPAGTINWEAGDSSNIITTLTDDYGRILVSRADMNDPFAPGWWLLRIEASGRGIEFTPERGWRERYYIRINQLKAPGVAGRYLLKIFLGDQYPVRSQSHMDPISYAMPVENWPVLLVKGDRDPAVIHGTVRYGGESSLEIHGSPLRLPGMVRAVGVACNPETGELTSRPVEARGYFNASANGHFEVEGIAPGVYDVYASAAGFPEQLVARDVKLWRGQSLQLDIYLTPGPELRGTLYSKGPIGLTPWRTTLPVSIAIYSSDNYIEQNIVSFSPINLTHAPYTSYVTGNTVFTPYGLAAPNKPRIVAFPWEGPVGYYPYTAPPSFRDPFGVYNGVGPAQAWWVDPEGSPDPVTGLGSEAGSFRFQFGREGYYGIPSRLSGMVPQVFASWIDGLKPGTYFVRAFINGYIQSEASGEFSHSYFTVYEDTRDISVSIDLRPSGLVNATVHFHSSPGTIMDDPIGGPDPGRFLIAEAYSGDGSLAAFNFTYVPAAASSATILLNGFGMAGPIPPPDPRMGVKYSLFRYRGLRDYGLYPGPYTLRLYMRGYIQADPPASNLEDLDQPLVFSISLGGEASVSAHMYRGGGLNVTVTSMDWEKPPVARPWAWNGAPVSILVYDLASRSFVDSIYFWNQAGHSWSIPVANSISSTLPWPGWRTIFGAGASMTATNGSTILERLGPDLPLKPSPHPDRSMATNNFIQALLHAGFLYSPMTYRGLKFESKVALYPGFYAATAWSYGYVQEGIVAPGDLGREIVHVNMGAISDLSLQIFKGVEFNVTIVFRREGLLTRLPFNASMRIRIYDERDMLVAAASTSLDAGAALSVADAGFFADGRKIGLSGGSSPPIPAGTATVEYKRLAGLFSYTDPSLGEALRRLMLFPGDRGVWGSSIYPLDGAYEGTWTILVELVNWYQSSSFYPPPPALLQGETHLTNLTSLLPYNHLGPFELRTRIVIPNTGLGGAKSITLGLDQRGYLNGIIATLNLHDEPRVASWIPVSAVDMDGGEAYTVYSWDGRYEMYLPAGTYQVTLEEPGYTPRTIALTISEGSDVTCNFTLEQGASEVPEYPSNLLPLAAAIPLLLAHRAKKNK